MEIKFGKIIFEAANEGSKSESVQPFLVEADGTKTQIFLEGDNPFENTALRSLEGKDVAVSGAQNEGSTIFTALAASQNPLSQTEQNTEAQ